MLKNNNLNELLKKRFADPEKMYDNMYTLSSSAFHTLHKNDFDDSENKVDEEFKFKFQDNIIKNALLNSVTLTEQEISILLPNGNLDGTIFEKLKNTESTLENCPTNEKKLKITQKNDHIMIAGGGYNIDRDIFNYTLEVFKLISEGIKKIREGEDINTICNKVSEKVKEIKYKPSTYSRLSEDIDSAIKNTLNRAQNTAAIVTQTDEKLLHITEEFKSAQQAAKSANEKLNAEYDQHKALQIDTESQRLFTAFKAMSETEKQNFKKNFTNKIPKNYLHGQFRKFKELIDFKYSIDEKNIDDTYLDKSFKNNIKKLEDGYSEGKKKIEDTYASKLKDIIFQQLDVRITDDEIKKLFVKDWFIDIQKLRNLIKLAQCIKCREQIKKDLGEIIKNKISESVLDTSSIDIEDESVLDTSSIDIKNKCLSIIIKSVEDNFQIDEGQFKQSAEYQEINKLVNIMEKKLSTWEYNEDFIDKICKKICQFIDKYLNRIVTLSDEKKVQYCMDNQKGAEYLSEKITNVLSKPKKSWGMKVMDQNSSQSSAHRLNQ